MTDYTTSTTTDTLAENIAMTHEHQFAIDVKKGLQSHPKTLPSKYFYDKIGDALFVDIMHMPEYYLSRAELEIFTQKTQQIIAALKLTTDTYFELIELGAGDGTKTKALLHVLIEKGYQFDYKPIDISQHALNALEADLTQAMPTLNVTTKQGDYFDVLNELNHQNHRKIVLFLGSNIGNLNDDLSAAFLSKLNHNLQPNDGLLLGVDLIKPAEIVLPAYHDKGGITAAFNLNLLARINRELGANFDLTKFKHQPEYNENEGIAKSYLVSTIPQTVHIELLDETFSFEQGEKIHTEISRKYNDQIINTITSKTNLKAVEKIMDTNQYFADYVLIKQ